MFEIYATAQPVPESRRRGILGLKFATKAEALDRARHLLRQGWSVYRVSGPDGFEMDEQAVAQLQDPHGPNSGSVSI